MGIVTTLKNYFSSVGTRLLAYLDKIGKFEPSIFAIKKGCLVLEIPNEGSGAANLGQSPHYEHEV